MVCKKEKMSKKLSFKIWILIIAVVLSLLSIFVSSNGVTFFQKGVVVTSVEPNSTAFELGLRQNQIITSIDGQKIDDLNDYSLIIQEKFPSDSEKKITIKTKESEVILFSKNPPQLTVADIPKTDIKTGLDLAGGARAIVKAKDKELSGKEVNDLVAITNNRLNVYGLSDVNVNPVSDLSGKHFMLIEIAGSTPKDLKDLIEKQGKFEAKIGEDVVFSGGNKDVSSVCRNDASCAGIYDCQPSQGQYICSFRFTIYLSEEAAKRHAEVTDKLTINESNPKYLSEKLDLYLDDNLVDSLFIGKELKGKTSTQISISGSGSGPTQSEAFEAAEEDMHHLQTVLITGSLPYKLEIVKLDTISPVLGKDFTRAILTAGLAALLVVAIIIFLRYKKLKSSLALLATSLSEVIIILGIAALIEWNLDLPSIAGILATIGTGIDQQIIILDESRQKLLLSVKQKLKRAFSIILGAYFTALVSLIPLLWAGAGLLKGFAITTIIGITAGVLITRPAFTDMVRNIEK